MNIQDSFTPEQIAFLKNHLFDTLADKWSFPLIEAKRKKVLSQTFGASNYDALLQRLPPLESAPEKDKTLLTLFKSVASGANDTAFLINQGNLRPSDWDFLLSQYQKCTFAPLRLHHTDQVRKLLKTLCPFKQASLYAALNKGLNLGYVKFSFVPAPLGNLNNELSDFSAPLQNDNCLVDMRCPHCASETGFFIETHGVDPNSEHLPELKDRIIDYVAYWEDDGSADTLGDTDFTAGGSCRCANCSFEGSTVAFREISVTQDPEFSIHLVDRNDGTKTFDLFPCTNEMTARDSKELTGHTVSVTFTDLRNPYHNIVLTGDEWRDIESNELESVFAQSVLRGNEDKDQFLLEWAED